MEKIVALAFCLALFLIALAIPATAQTANTAACQRTVSALNAEQRVKLSAWIKQEPAGQDLTVDHLCAIDAKSAVVALIDFNGLDSAVYVVNFGAAQATARRVWSGAIDAASLLRPDGGSLKLVFATQAAARTPGARAFERRVMLLDLATAQSETLASGIIDPSGACRGSRLLRLYPRVADINRDGQPDIVVEREEIGCDQDKPARRQENFLAGGAGYRRQ